MKNITWGGVQCRFVEKQCYFYEGDELKYLLYEIEVKLISSSNIETKKLSGENRIIEINISYDIFFLC